jgi:hypothetical protein
VPRLRRSSRNQTFPSPRGLGYRLVAPPALRKVGLLAVYNSDLFACKSIDLINEVVESRIGRAIFTQLDLVKGAVFFQDFGGNSGPKGNLPNPAARCGRRAERDRF